MKIVDMFQKTLSRDIKGVIVADELDNQIAFQELDEYVVTKELTGHLRKLISSYLAGIDNPSNIAARSDMAVWISGFFGSGKSHFLKILSYLLDNRLVTPPGSNEKAKAIDFFESKIKDGMMLADLKRMVDVSAEVILFNIDAKANSGENNSALLSVFLRVFNEMQGFNGDYPHIADLELFLQEKAVTDVFRQEFERDSGSNWLECRDAYSFYEDSIVHALIKALEMSESAARNKFIDLGRDYKITIEGFANKIKDYLKTKPANHRLIFLVDEVGQFIGQNGKLMLNLQTITEELGSLCNGQAWVIVTSQEDIDAALGDVKDVKDHDFSKIQGRFKTRLSLSSSNTDEVIQLRLLEKTDNAKDIIGQLFDKEAVLIKNQIRFESSGPTLKGISDKSDFVAVYPFASYQFQLVQDVFESIRKAGATGLHLSRGERSMLNAFQDAAQINQDKELGALVPFKDFYPSIESFLDTSVKKAIDQAGELAVLKPLDLDLLKVLFLIRYTDKRITGTIDNLVTLMIDHISTDRVKLKANIDAGLRRLEKENLIALNGEIWSFLTNEEQDVSREIKKEDISGSEIAKTLSEWIYDEVFKGKSKHRYTINKRDYSLTRLCDNHSQGRQLDNDLTIEIFTPLFSDFAFYNESKCIMRSMEGNGRLVIKLPDNEDLARQVRTFLQTHKYILKRSDASAPQSLQKILRERSDQNKQAEKRIIELLESMLLDAEFFALNKSLTDVKGSTALSMLDNCLDYLIENIFTKLTYIRVHQENPQREISAVLLCDDIAQQKLLDKPENNPQAIKEVREYLKHKIDVGRVILKELIDHFAGGSFGWPEWEIVLIIARLYKAEEIHLVSAGSQLNSRQAQENLLKSKFWNQISLDKRLVSDKKALKEAKDLGQKLFAQIGPDGEERLCQFLVDHLNYWHGDLKEYRGTAKSGNFPGLQDINSCISLIEKQLHLSDKPFRFIEEFNTNKNELLDMEEDFNKLNDFYTSQIQIWRKITSNFEGLIKPDIPYLQQDKEVESTIRRLLSILKSPEPYSLVSEANSIIDSLKKTHNEKLIARRENAIECTNNIIEELRTTFAKYEMNDFFENVEFKQYEEHLERFSSLEKLTSFDFLGQMLERDRKESLDNLQVELKKLNKQSEAAGVKDELPVREVSLPELLDGEYIKNYDDVEVFIAKVKSHLDGILNYNYKIKLK